MNRGSLTIMTRGRHDEAQNRALRAHIAELEQLKGLRNLKGGSRFEKAFEAPKKISVPWAVASRAVASSLVYRSLDVVVHTCTPKLLDAMDAGDVSTDAAPAITKQPPGEQKRIVDLPKRERKAAVRRLLKPPAFHVPPQPSWGGSSASGRSASAVPVSNRPAARVASNTDRRIDPSCIQSLNSAKPGRQTLSESLVDRWSDEMNAAIASRLPFSSAGSELLN